MKNLENEHLARHVDQAQLTKTNKDNSRTDPKNKKNLKLLRTRIETESHLTQVIRYLNLTETLKGKLD